MPKTRVIKYISKPQEVETMRFDGSIESAVAICNWVSSNGQQARIIHHTLDDTREIRVTTDDFSSDMSPGDFIVKLNEYKLECYTPQWFHHYYDRKRS